MPKYLQYPSVVSQHMNSDSNTDIRLAFSAGVEPHRVAVAVAAAPVSSVVTDSEARSEVDFLSLLKLGKMFDELCKLRHLTRQWTLTNTRHQRVGASHRN